MNKWKIAFWVCLLFFIFSLFISFYSIVDQGVSLTHLRESYSDKENDLNDLIQIINKTDLSKKQIEKELENHRLFEYMNFDNDSVSLESITLIFENEKLKKITKD
jgi:hypothetical protein